MGNRAVITTAKRDLGIYLHWNGGRSSVEAFLKYCDMRGFASPEQDPYGWARLCQVIANFFGPEGLSVGISRYSKDSNMNPGDNGIYVIENWQIIGRITPSYFSGEQYTHSLDEMLQAIDEAQPKDQQLGEVLRAREVATEDLKAGDTVYMLMGGRYKPFTVLGFGDEGRITNGHDVSGIPYVGRFKNDDTLQDNINNFIMNKSVFKKIE